MDDQITWSLQGATVIAADDALLFMPHGNHRLLIKKALDLLSNDIDFTVPLKVTVHDLPWPIKAIVEPNDCRIPIWATHAHHQRGERVETAGLSPFVCASRELRLPITKSLTIDIAGTMNNPVINAVYPGSVLPLLPWQIGDANDVAEYEMSVAFWQTHSFVFDKTIAFGQQDSLPDWYTDVSSPLPLLLK